MKITERRLKRIIREELSLLAEEAKFYGGEPGPKMTSDGTFDLSDETVKRARQSLINGISNVQNGAHGRSKYHVAFSGALPYQAVNQWAEAQGAEAIVQLSLMFAAHLKGSGKTKILEQIHMISWDHAQRKQGINGLSNPEVGVTKLVRWLDKFYVRGGAKLPNPTGKKKKSASSGKIKATDFGVDSWGSVGKWLHRTEIPAHLIGGTPMSVQGYLNKKAKQKGYVKNVLGMDAAGQAQWVLDNLPKVSRFSLGGGSIVLTNRDGHADVYFQCAPWMPKIWLYPLVKSALENLGGPDVFGPFIKGISEKIENAAVNVGANERFAGLVSDQISKSLLDYLKPISSQVKHYRYQLDRLLVNDPMIVWLIKEGSDLIETIMNFEIYIPGEPSSRELVETWVIRDIMKNAFPSELDGQLRTVCKKVNWYLEDIRRVPIKSDQTLGDVMTMRGMSKEGQDKIVTKWTSVAKEVAKTA